MNLRVLRKVLLIFLIFKIFRLKKHFYIKYNIFYYNHVYIKKQV
jgi:hypothetical protein